jgi:hypothetical protein
MTQILKVDTEKHEVVGEKDGEQGWVHNGSVEKKRKGNGERENR